MANATDDTLVASFETALSQNNSGMLDILLCQRPRLFVTVDRAPPTDASHIRHKDDSLRYHPLVAASGIGAFKGVRALLREFFAAPKTTSGGSSSSNSSSDSKSSSMVGGNNESKDGSTSGASVATRRFASAGAGETKTHEGERKKPPGSTRVAWSPEALKQMTENKFTEFSAKLNAIITQMNDLNTTPARRNHPAYKGQMDALISHAYVVSNQGYDEMKEFQRQEKEMELEFDLNSPGCIAPVPHGSESPPPASSLAQDRSVQLQSLMEQFNTLKDKYTIRSSNKEDELLQQALAASLADAGTSSSAATAVAISPSSSSTTTTTTVAARAPATTSSALLSLKQLIETKYMEHTTKLRAILVQINDSSSRRHEFRTKAADDAHSKEMKTLVQMAIDQSNQYQTDMSSFIKQQNEMEIGESSRAGFTPGSRIPGTASLSSLSSLLPDRGTELQALNEQLTQYKKSYNVGLPKRNPQEDDDDELQKVLAASLADVGGPPTTVPSPAVASVPTTTSATTSISGDNDDAAAENAEFEAAFGGVGSSFIQISSSTRSTIPPSAWSAMMMSNSAKNKSTNVGVTTSSSSPASDLSSPAIATSSSSALLSTISSSSSSSAAAAAVPGPVELKRSTSDTIASSDTRPWPASLTDEQHARICQDNALLFAVHTYQHPHPNPFHLPSFSMLSDLLKYIYLNSLQCCVRHVLVMNQSCVCYWITKLLVLMLPR
jgi:hypothetical protein